MKWALLAMAIVGVGFAYLTIFGRLYLCVSRQVSVDDIMTVAQHYICGGKQGRRTFVFHPITGTLVVVMKIISSGPAGEAQLMVAEYRLAPVMRRNPRSLCLAHRLLGSLYPWPYEVFFVPYRRLPSLQAGILVSTKECGVSVKAALSTVESIVVSDCPADEDVQWEVWCDNLGGSNMARHLEEVD